MSGRTSTRLPRSGERRCPSGGPRVAAQASHRSRRPLPRRARELTERSSHTERAEDPPPQPEERYEGGRADGDGSDVDAGENRKRHFEDAVHDTPFAKED